MAGLVAGRRWIAYSAGPAERSPHRIQLVDLEGSRRIALTDAWGPGGYLHDTQPCFSPDGRRLVFARHRMSVRESADLCVVDVPSAS